MNKNTNKRILELRHTIDSLPSDFKTERQNFFNDVAENRSSEKTSIIDDFANMFTPPQGHLDKKVSINIVISHHCIVRSFNDKGMTSGDVKGDNMIYSNARGNGDRIGDRGRGRLGMINAFSKKSEEIIYAKSIEHPGENWSYIKNIRNLDINIYQLNGEEKFVTKGWTNKILPTTKEKAKKYEDALLDMYKEGLLEPFFEKYNIDRIKVTLLNGEEIELKKQNFGPVHRKTITIPKDIDIPPIAKIPEDRKITLEAYDGLFGKLFHIGNYVCDIPGFISINTNWPLISSREGLNVDYSNLINFIIKEIKKFITELIIEGKISIYDTIPSFRRCGNNHFDKIILNLQNFVKIEKVWPYKGELVEMLKCKKRTGENSIYISDDLLEGDGYVFIDGPQDFLNFFDIPEVSSLQAHRILKEYHIPDNSSEEELLKFFNHRKQLGLKEYYYEGEWISPENPLYYGEEIEELKLDVSLVKFNSLCKLHKFLKEEKCLIPLSIDEISRKLGEKLSDKKLEEKDLEQIKKNQDILNFEILKEYEYEVENEYGASSSLADVYPNNERWNKMGLTSIIHQRYMKYYNILEKMGLDNVRFKEKRTFCQGKKIKRISGGNRFSAEYNRVQIPDLADIMESMNEERIKKAWMIVELDPEYYSLRVEHDFREEQFINNEEKRESYKRYCEKIPPPEWVPKSRVITENKSKGSKELKRLPDAYLISDNTGARLWHYMSVINPSKNDGYNELLKKLGAKTSKPESEFFESRLSELNIGNLSKDEYNTYYSELSNIPGYDYDISIYGLYDPIKKKNVYSPDECIQEDIPDVFKEDLSSGFAVQYYSLILFFDRSKVQRKIHPNNILHILQERKKKGTLKDLKNNIQYMEQIVTILKDYISTNPRQIEEINYLLFGQKEFFSREEFLISERDIVVSLNEKILAFLSMCPWMTNWDTVQKENEITNVSEINLTDVVRNCLGNFLKERNKPSDIQEYSSYKFFNCDSYNLLHKGKRHEVPFRADLESRKIFIRRGEDTSSVIIKICNLEKEDILSIESIFSESFNAINLYGGEFTPSVNKDPDKEILGDDFQKEVDFDDEKSKDEESSDEESKDEELSDKELELEKLLIVEPEYSPKGNPQKDKRKKTVPENKQPAKYTGDSQNRVSTGDIGEDLTPSIIANWLSILTKVPVSYSQIGNPKKCLEWEYCINGEDKFTIKSGNFKTGKRKSSVGWDFTSYISETLIKKYHLEFTHNPYLETKTVVTSIKPKWKLPSNAQSKAAEKYRKGYILVLIWGLGEGKVCYDIIVDPFADGEIYYKTTTGLKQK